MYIKHYSYLQTISYDVILLIHYSQRQRNKLSILQFLVLWNVGFKMHKIFISSHMISKTLLGLPSSRLSVSSSSSKLRIISVIPFNLFVLITQSSLTNWVNTTIPSKMEINSLPAYVLLKISFLLPDEIESMIA